MSKTLYDKIWENHLVHEQSDGTSLIYVDRHLVHEPNVYQRKLMMFHRFVHEQDGFPISYRIEF